MPYLRRLVVGFPSRLSGFEPRSDHVGFVVGKVTLGQVFSECFGFPCQFSFHRLLHTHFSFGAGKIGQLVADLPSGLSLTLPQETKKKRRGKYRERLESNRHENRDTRKVGQADHRRQKHSPRKRRNGGKPVGYSA
jgi:hypothetical protein